MKTLKEIVNLTLHELDEEIALINTKLDFYAPEDPYDDERIMLLSKGIELMSNYRILLHVLRDYDLQPDRPFSFEPINQ